MLKKINVQDIKLGMYIQEVSGNWMDNPFWKQSFKLTDPKALKKMTEYDIHEVWIDTKKGLDVDDVTVDLSEEESQKKIALKYQETAPSKVILIPHVTVHEELEQARVVHDKAKKAVTLMFQEVRMGKALQLDEINPLIDDIYESIKRNTEAFLSLSRLKNKDNYTYLHSIAVCALMMALGKQMGLDQQLMKDLGMSGLFHDIGKMMIPVDVLNKPGRLTDEEYTMVKKHPFLGWQILKKSEGVCDMALDVCLHHHERVDGRGYPEKLSGDTVSLFARMGAVCDVYDAITSDRCYKIGWDPIKSIREMAKWQAEGQFDKTVFHAFVKTIGIYPSGTLVKLKSTRLAVVLEQSAQTLLAPIVKVFFSTETNASIPPEIIDLSWSTDSILNPEDPKKWGFNLIKLSAC